MQTNGNKGDDFYKKLKSLVKGEKLQEESTENVEKPKRQKA